MGPGAEGELPAGGGRGGVLVVAGDASCGYFLFTADAAVRAALEDEDPMS